MKENPVCLSHIGSRVNQEDNFLFCNRFLEKEEADKMKDGEVIFLLADPEERIKFYAISDGMGGHNGGEVASFICTSRLAELQEKIQNYREFNQIVGAIQSTIFDINEEINRVARTDPSLSDMGATLILLVQIENYFLFFNLGDSRAYFFGNNKLVRITSDNTKAQRLIDLHLIEEEDRDSVSHGSNLIRYLGYNQPGVTLKADEYFYKAPKIPGYIILCSDGISDYIQKEDIKMVLNSNVSLIEKGKELIRNAVSNEGSDNATIIIIPIGGTNE